MLSLRRLLRPTRVQLISCLPSRRGISSITGPFLLDTYTPRHQFLSHIQLSKKRSSALAHLRLCNICPRKCAVNRFESTGYCLIGATAKVSTIAPHFGEEPCVQGSHGSGTVFFSGCSLRCSFCQNHDISHQRAGFDLEPIELAGWMMKLQEAGCANINFVTPEHVVPQAALAIIEAVGMGLKVPIVYNTSSYDSPEALELMNGLVDIYLADFKLSSSTASKRLLKAGDYPKVAKESLKLMHEQVGDLSFTSDGVAKSGVLVRHLVMPGFEEEGGEIMRFLAGLSRNMYVHIMEQYIPAAHVGKNMRGKEGVRYEDINRPVKENEVNSVRKAAEEAGLWRFCEEARGGMYA